MTSGYQASQHFQQLQSHALQLARDYEQLCAQATQRLDDIVAQRQETQRELARAYLQSLDTHAFERVERLTGFLGFQRRNPLEAMAHERTVLEHAIGHIRAEPYYRDRQLLVGPDGTLTTKLVEVEEMLAPWVTECATYESQEGFVELYRIGYDTPRFEEKWWQASYWTHWSWGDRICAALGKGDFGDDVLPAYEKAAAQRDFWTQEQSNLFDQIKAVHELVQQHDDAVARIPNLPALYLEHSQEYLANYLGDADTGLLEEWLGKEPGEHRAERMELRKLSGLCAKGRYLEELISQGLTGVIRDMYSRATKYGRKVQKFQRQKHASRRIRSAELDHGFEEKYNKHRQNCQKLSLIVERLYAYDDYARFDLDNDPELWWYEFTGRPPPRFIPGLHSWYQRHPNHQPNHDHWRDSDDDDVAAEVMLATAARDLDEVGYLS